MSSFDSFFRAHGRDSDGVSAQETATEAGRAGNPAGGYARILGYGKAIRGRAEVWKSLLYRIATNLAISQQRMNRVRNVSGQCPAR